MKIRFRALNVRRWKTTCFAALLTIALFQGMPTVAAAQTLDPTVAQIRDDAHFTAYTVGKIDGRIREVRRATLALLVLNLVTLVGCAYVLAKKTGGAGQTMTTSATTMGAVNAKPWLAAWHESTTVARLRKRQRKLAHAIAELQSFADHAANTSKEMSTLLAMIRREMQALDQNLGNQSMQREQRS